MIVYRLGRTKYATQLTGEGSKLHGGRWNVIGQPCVYTSETKALCILEFAANVYLDEITSDLSLTTIEIPDKGWPVFQYSELPEGWRNKPSTEVVKQWGTQQLQKQLVLKLPSVIVSSEYNYLLNPLHPEFKKVNIKEVEPFIFDVRIKQ